MKRMTMTMTTGAVAAAAITGMADAGIMFFLDEALFDQALAGRPLLLLAMILVVTGVQLFTMGLLGELGVRTYHEVQNKPTYVVRQVLGDQQPAVEKVGASPGLVK